MAGAGCPQPGCDTVTVYDGAAAAVFAEYMASPEVLAYAKAFLGCEEDELMWPDTDFVIFCNPPEGYTQGWHRCARRPSLDAH